VREDEGRFQGDGEQEDGVGRRDEDLRLKMGEEQERGEDTSDGGGVRNLPQMFHHNG